jgi:hypothetical protein
LSLFSGEVAVAAGFGPASGLQEVKSRPAPAAAVAPIKSRREMSRLVEDGFTIF